MNKNNLMNVLLAKTTLLALPVLAFQFGLIYFP